MPSPLAHTLIGYILYRKKGDTVIKRDSHRWLILFQTLFIIGLSYLPDLDSLPGFIFKDLGGYHNQFSHSLLFGLFVALVIMLGSYLLRAKHPAHWFWLTLASYWLHIFMDFLTPGRGVMLAWPFTDQRFSSPIKLFYGLHWSEGLFSMQHIWTILTESLFIAAILLAWHFLSKGRFKGFHHKHPVIFAIAIVIVVMSIGTATALWKRTGGLQLAAHPGTDQLSQSITTVIESPAKIVWIRDCSEKNDAYALGNNLELMGLDTEDGLGERIICPGPRNISRPLISPDGTYVIFSDRDNSTVYRIDWDGRNQTEVGPGRALCVWKNPDDHTLWVYIGNAATDHPRYHSAITRKRIAQPSISESICDSFTVNENNIQLSSDGQLCSADARGHGMGIINLNTMAFTKMGNGCWPSLAPDDSKLFFCVDNGHRQLMFNDGKRQWKTDISNAPGVDGYEVFHTRWSNNPRFIILTGPYKEGMGFNRIGNGGPAVDVYIGKFTPDFSAIETWVQVTTNECADFYPDLWLCF